MPSVCNGHAPVVAAEGTELGVAKLVVSYIEKKYRNLDKRKVSTPPIYMIFSFMIEQAMRYCQSRAAD